MIKIYGLIGYPVKHSLSPAMHNVAFRTLKINAEYRLFELKSEDLEGFFLGNISAVDTEGKSFSSQDISGFNITIPYKVKAKEILEKRFPFDQNISQMLEGIYYVKLSGAINTVRREGGELRYFNTDASGFLKSLEKDLNFVTNNKCVLIIGCGGAGRAVIAALSWEQEQIKKIYINDINSGAINSAKKHFSQFPHLTDRLEFVTAKNISKIIKDCHLLINASPVGMRENNDSVIDKKLLHKDLSVYDVVYNRETQLIKDAKSLGLSAANGLGMLLYQGVDAFQLWMNQEAPVEVMRRALQEAINK